MRDLLVIDLETSGFDADVHAILEVGAVLLDGETLEERRSFAASIDYTEAEVAYIRANAHPLAFAVNGWTGPAPDAIRIERALRELWGLQSAPVTLVGHHVEFDRGFLVREWRRRRGDQPPDWMDSSYHTLDTRHLAYPLVRCGLVDSRSLSPVAAFFGIQRPEPHRAIADARVTAEVLRRLVARAEHQEVTDAA